MIPPLVTEDKKCRTCDNEKSFYHRQTDLDYANESSSAKDGFKTWCVRIFPTIDISALVRHFLHTLLADNEFGNLNEWIY